MKQFNKDNSAMLGDRNGTTTSFFGYPRKVSIVSIDEEAMKLNKDMVEDLLHHPHWNNTIITGVEGDNQIVRSISFLYTIKKLMDQIKESTIQYITYDTDSTQYAIQAQPLCSVSWIVASIQHECDKFNYFVNKNRKDLHYTYSALFRTIHTTNSDMCDFILTATKSIDDNEENDFSEMKELYSCSLEISI